MSCSDAETSEKSAKSPLIYHDAWGRSNSLQRNMFASPVIGCRRAAALTMRFQIEVCHVFISARAFVAAD